MPLASKTPGIFQTPWMAKAIIMIPDASTFFPIMMMMLLAGLQAIPKELTAAAKTYRANGRKAFWEVTFPLMLPVSITAILIRFILRKYRKRSNVG